MRTILLGEAPKRLDGFAFDADSWTTQQIAAVLDVDPFDLNRVFWVMNVFERPQRAKNGGYDRFSKEAAADELFDLWFESQRIICVGARVSSAMELALDLDEGVIPENEFRRFDRTSRGNGWELARIPHPSGLRGHEDRDGLVLPRATRSFLLRAAGFDPDDGPRGRRRRERAR
jgi:hypothetical protein